MKDKAQRFCHSDLYPDVVTYTTLLKGFGQAKDLHSVQKIVLEMKSRHDLFIDRTAFTSMVDAMLNCSSIKDALCIFGEILKRAGANEGLRPKPHLYISMMRAFAGRGDYIMVKNLHKRLWPDSAGTISLAVQQEADHLLMESALNNGQIDAVLENLSKIINRWKCISWTSRGGMVALRLEALLGFTKSMLSPYLLPQVLPGDPIESIMMPFETARPLPGTLELKRVVMRLYRETLVPIIDDYRIDDYRENCCELLTPLLLANINMIDECPTFNNDEKSTSLCYNDNNYWSRSRSSFGKEV
ncbi:pentatricopeptide repeat-containing protein At5g10690-like [Hibiscus syriacus]|uniref:pentatricopeptide repeat-containing protein At5g10690-like n=1 Tax=Hibiscus syriacus TaxID=106335 RepID=UPI001921C9D1|nr:pentatricopeptide repeat-containing protein At5g10690-like [Hibiscus syriacus]